MSTQEQCSEEVWDGFHSHTCRRTGVVQRKGQWYCRQHDPVERERKIAAKVAARERENARYDRRIKLQALGVEIADACLKHRITLPYEIQRLAEKYRKLKESAEVKGS